MSGFASAPTDLLPKSHAEFREKGFWDEFFIKRNSEAFEWYGAWDDVAPLMQQYLPASKEASVLVVGCGNSSTSEEMFDAGYGSVRSIDFSTAVIQEMEKKTPLAKKRGGLKYELMDMLMMTYNDETYNAVFDKGALDALMSDESAQSTEEANQMFSEVARVLTPGGFYLCVTLAQQQIMSALFRFFRVGFNIHIHTFSPQDGSALCPFFFAVQKWATSEQGGASPNIVTYFDGTAEAANLGEAIKRIRKAQQVHNMLGGPIRSSSTRVLPLQLWSQNNESKAERDSNNSSPRYEVSLMDPEIKATQGLCCVCIVPIGREHEWMFAVEEGQMQLAESAGYARFILVRMNRGHEYENMESIQKELSAHMSKLAPPGTSVAESQAGTKIPFVTISQDIGFRDCLDRGISSLSGEYVIEEVKGDDDGERRRRLVFLSNMGAIQSEARIKRVKIKSGRSGNKKGKKKKGGKGKKKSSVGNQTAIVVDHGFLAFEYHRAMLIAPIFLQTNFEGGAKACVIGTGGGLFAMFLQKHVPRLVLETVDLDPEMPKIAKEWFGMKESAGLSSFVGDGIEFLQAQHDAGSKYHMVFVDVDSKDLTEGLMFPPKVFLDNSFLQLANDCLLPNGVLVINLAARASKTFTDAMEQIRGVFSEAHVVPIAGDVNRVVLALKTGLGKAPSSLSKAGERTLKLMKVTEDIASDVMNYLASVESTA